MKHNCISIVSFHPDNKFLNELLKLTQKYGYTTKVTLDTFEIIYEFPLLLVIVNEQDEP
jgi:hypothetical protein